MSIPFTGYGTTASVNDGAANAQALFNTVTKAKIPNLTVDIEPYVLLAQSDKIKQKLPKMQDNNKLELTMQYNSADYARLVALRGLKYVTGTTEVTFVVTTSDPTPKTHTIRGIVSNIEVSEFDADKIPDIKVTVEVSGAIAVS